MLDGAAVAVAVGALVVVALWPLAQKHPDTDEAFVFHLIRELLPGDDASKKNRRSSD